MKVVTPKQITEEQGIHEKWYEEAKIQTPETIGTFIKKLSLYQHDYGTICHAAASAAIGAAWSIDKSPQGGITGFQAGAIMWEFIKHWNYRYNKCGLKIIDYDTMLYPQYEDSYQKVIDQNTWKALQEEAKKRINEANEFKETFISTKVLQHLRSIIEGNVPFGYSVKDDE